MEDRAPAQRARIEHLNSLAHVLDDSIRIPGTGMRIGLDAIIGLVPGIGDAAGGVMSAYIVLQAARLGTPVPVLLRMLLNLVVETVVGGIPLLGDLFDAGYKANLRNLTLLRRSLDTPGPARRSSALVVVGVSLALLALLAAIGFGAFIILRAVVMVARGEVVQA
jgi:hypothetical protein